MQQTKLINILIRTSNRPELFARCIRSIESQLYKNINIIVSYDTEVKPEYIPDHLQCIKVTPQSGHAAHYNLYCNALKEAVTEGWFMFIDDDDYIHSPYSLLKLVQNLNISHATICRFLRNGRPKPAKDNIIEGKIGMPCIVLHSSHKSIARFDGSISADYKFIKAISAELPVLFSPVIVVATDRRSFGK